MRAHDCGEGSSEDLTTPGTSEFDLSNRPSVLIFSMENHPRSQRDQHAKRLSVKNWCGCRS